MKYHPQSDKLFVSSDCRGNVCLRDVRIAFGGNSIGTAGGTVLKVKIIYIHNLQSSISY